MIRVREGEEERLLTIEEFEAKARRGELSPFAWVQNPALTGDRFVQARELPLFVSLYDPRRIHFRRHFQLGRLPLVTGAVALLAVALFFLSQKLGEGVVTRDGLLLLGAKARARIVEDGEAWRLLVANLLHRDSVHLGFNLFALLNVGTVLEGVYRRGDYVLLLVVAGLSTMTTSVLLSDPVTVGASGLVFGCLGAAVVFGWRYGEVLPLRYRIYFGVIVVGYAAVMFYLGLRSQSTDNWGHAGGLVSGVAMGALLTPRLLRLTAPREPLVVVARPYLLAAGLALLFAWPVGFAARALLFRLVPYRVPAFGVQLVRPAHWTKASDPLGFLTFGNGVDAFASLGCARLSGPSRLDEAVERFTSGELEALARGGHIGNLRTGPAVLDGVGSGAHRIEARKVPFSFMASDGPLESEALLFSRGQIECALVLARRPSAPASSLSRLDEIQRGIIFIDTRAEEQAARLVRARPSARAWLELALARQSAGRTGEARRAFEEAEAALDESPGLSAQVRYARARFELGFGGDLEVALAQATRLHEAGADRDTELLYVDALLAMGKLDEAERVLDAAERAHPQAVGFAERRGWLAARRAETP